MENSIRIERPTIWAPQPKQAEFMSRPEKEALYGGAAGGGKSDALVIEALRQVHIPHYRAIIFRKTFQQLTTLIDKSINYYKQVEPRAKYNDTKHTWTFPSGAKIIFGNMQHAKDKQNYQGKDYDFIGFDELTHFTWPEYSYLFGRNRATGPGTRVYTRATANPGGVGHGWVKNRFILAGKPYETIWEKFRIIAPDGVAIEGHRSRVFIPSTVFDNEKLLENDPEYIINLAALPEADKKALLYGDWNSFSGQVFAEWVDNPNNYESRQNTHVIAPFKVPEQWRIWRSFDWGYSKPFSCHWYAADHEGRLYCIREFYGSDGEPDVGVKWEPTAIASKIKEIESIDANLKGKRIYGIADPAIFAATASGRSIADLFDDERVHFDRADHTRIAGKMQVHHRLVFDKSGMPMLYFFNTCKHMIRTLPTLVYDEKDVEDVDTAGEDHCLVGDTLVWTLDGKIKISDLVEQEGKVLSHDGNYYSFYDVRKTQSNVDVFTVELEDGTKITATPNHRFMLKSGEWKRLDELQEGDDLWSV